MTRSQTQTREKVLLAARSLFSMYGYQAATVDDMLTAAGITKGAFYHYFKSKELLCLAAIDEVAYEYELIIQSVPSNAGPLDKLVFLVEKIAQLNSSGQWLNCRIMLKLITEPHDESPQLQARLNEFYVWYRGTYCDLLNEAKKENLLGPKANIKMLTDLILSVLMGSTILTQIDPNPAPAGAIGEYILKLLKP